MNEPYVSTQISVLKTDKKLVAFYDKLRFATTDYYAQLHADGEYAENGRKVRSLIGLTLLDYSQGKKDNTITVKANLSPDEVEFIFSRLYAGFPVFEFRQDKIFGGKDEQGYSSVTKLSISRNTHDYKGTVFYNIVIRRMEENKVCGIIHFIFQSIPVSTPVLRVWI